MFVCAYLRSNSLLFSSKRLLIYARCRAFFGAHVFRDARKMKTDESCKSVRKWLLAQGSGGVVVDSSTCSHTLNRPLCIEKTCEFILTAVERLTRAMSIKCEHSISNLSCASRSGNGVRRKSDSVSHCIEVIPNVLTLSAKHPICRSLHIYAKPFTISPIRMRDYRCL